MDFACLVFYLCIPILFLRAWDLGATSQYLRRLPLTLNNYDFSPDLFTLNTNAMILSPDSDVTAMRIHLNELRSRFEQAMRDGESFTMMKEIHLQIKELESSIKVLEWNGGSINPMVHSDPASRGSGVKKYRYVEEPPPLL